jgi:hypothetical protein
MARPELVVNISASSPTGSNSNSNSNGSSYTRGSPRPGYASPDHHLTSRSPPPPSIPEHYTASRAALTPTPVSIPERAAASSPLRHHRHAYSKESMREYTSSLGGGGGGGDPSRHSSLTSRPTAASPPPMSYHSTTPFAAQPQGTSGGHGHDRGNGSTGGARPRASHASMGTHTSNTVTTIVAAIEADPSNGWRPGWLRKRVIGAFVGVFILMGVCAEISMAVADGTEADSRVEGLWTFGPVISETLAPQTSALPASANDFLQSSPSSRPSGGGSSSRRSTTPRGSSSTSTRARASTAPARPRDRRRAPSSSTTSA